MQSLRAWAKALKREVYALYFVGQDPRVSWVVKVIAVCTVAYAFSPIDLIPDFIPIVGYLDDLLIVPLGIFIVFKLVPAKVIADCRAKANTTIATHQFTSQNWIAAIVVVLIWILVGAAIGLLLWRYWHRQ
jgi:uncharacterized membrane protein YkvA (DUF1232 family)